MQIIKYPTETSVNEAIQHHEPLLALISFDGETMLISHIDEAMEHHILFAKAGFKNTDIDKYFKIILDEDGADWTFICPPDYKNITDKTRRIGEFYKDGFNIMSSALLEIGIPVGINIPKRYRWHFDMMGE